MPRIAIELEKDRVLDRLAGEANVAQFVSFAPTLEQRFSRIAGFPANRHFAGLTQAIDALLSTAPDRTVNVRSFQPLDPKSREFIYGLSSVDAVETAVRGLAAQGLFTIVNETIDVRDGGVSGVVAGDLLEFAPEDTPRCVEKPGVAALPRSLGMQLLEIVYGFTPALANVPNLRVEFSVHPLRRGVRHEHTIIWESEDIDYPPARSTIRWPNRFSRFIGDKAYGLLIAHLLGCPVSQTLVIGRRLAPFGFGEPTGSGERWLRTAPCEQAPGRYTTTRGWTDPYALLQREDENGAIASVLTQDGIDAMYSGSCIAPASGAPIVEGVQGYGDRFMTGEAAPERLPADASIAVLDAYERLASDLGPVRFEWCWDQKRLWILQLHVGQTGSTQDVIVPGEPVAFRIFDTSRGIEALRSLIEEVLNTKEGVLLQGRVGITSHFGDLLRRASVPSRILAGESRSVD